MVCRGQNQRFLQLPRSASWRPVSAIALRFLWEGEPGDTRKLTYAELHREVCKFANVLKQLGIEPGDRVSIYMPMVPELAIAMLACADRRDSLGDLRRLFGRGDRRS